MASSFNSSIAEPCNTDTWTGYAAPSGTTTLSNFGVSDTPNTHRDSLISSVGSNDGDTIMSDYANNQDIGINNGVGGFMPQETPTEPPPWDYSQTRIPPQRRRVYNQLSMEQERLFLNQAQGGSQATYYASPSAPTTAQPSNSMDSQTSGLRLTGLLTPRTYSSPTPLEPRTSNHGPVPPSDHLSWGPRSQPVAQGVLSSGTVHGPSQRLPQQQRPMYSMPPPSVSHTGIHSIPSPSASLLSNIVPLAESPATVSTVPTWTHHHLATSRPLQQQLQQPQPQPQPQQHRQHQNQQPHQHQRHDSFPTREPPTAPRYPNPAVPTRGPQLAAYGRAQAGAANAPVPAPIPVNAQARLNETQRPQYVTAMQQQATRMDSRVVQDYSNALYRNQRQLQRQRAAANQSLHPVKSLDNKTDGRPDPKESEDLNVSLECKICFTQLVDTVILPCGHAVLCRWCADVHMPSCRNDPNRLEGNPICPICRGTVRHKCRIYFS
ncbi:C3HC4 finger protein [Aspergillus homomorphus CBS 101889]|uniref:RING-type domain-containing protein n=1 Tax=Aspergillus homomorphus (strain CBS 101889) TaxID=1450537 RepID=A0A395I247_ASPHC|nr:hypothetical protein BO97DRAFT_422671 [Aspergillus homomorphus CBS 101889]RAL14241.1 hypothetical protein BO97DRAFT_422671 [Aspergillus homomorphus CBS 101889]